MTDLFHVPRHMSSVLLVMSLVGSLLGATLWGGLGAMAGQGFGGGANENVLIWAAGGFIFGAVFGALKPEEGWTTVFRR